MISSSCDSAAGIGLSAGGLAAELPQASTQSSKGGQVRGRPRQGEAPIEYVDVVISPS